MNISNLSGGIVYAFNNRDEVMRYGYNARQFALEFFSIIRAESQSP